MSPLSSRYSSAENRYVREDTLEAGSTARVALVAGAAAGPVTVAGIKVGDVLRSVTYYVGTPLTDVLDLTAEFTITAANTISNVGGTASTGGKLQVQWAALS